MPLYGEKQNAVLIHGGILVWDAITQPETNDSGKTRWSAKIVVPPSSPDIPLLQQLAQGCLQASKWQGVLPAGGRMPIGQATMHEFNGLYPGWHVINGTTYRSPSVHEEGTGRLMEPMEYGALFYTGQRVDVVITCFDYDNIGKGIGSTLEGICPVMSAQAPRIALGSGGVDSSSAFGGAPAPAAAPVGAPPVPPAAGAPPTQAQNFLPGQPGAPAAGAPPPPPPPAPTKMLNGVAYTLEQLTTAGYTPQQIAAL